MNRPRLIRGLRIAVSVFFGVPCILLVALWVRSYWWHDGLTLTVQNPQTFFCYSNRGRLSFRYEFRPDKDEWVYTSFQPNFREEELRLIEEQVPCWRFSTSPLNTIFPHWFAVMIFGFLMAVPWLYQQWNFSLRTLLIATTLIAVVLGILVWSIQ